MAKRVLVVDDGAFMRLLIKQMLIKCGYEIVGEAENGKEAVQKYEELMPDLVTLDITMPIMDGLEALKEIMAIDKNAKVVMVSAMGQEVYVREAIRCGAKSFVVKPFDEGTLIAVIEGGY